METETDTADQQASRDEDSSRSNLRLVYEAESRVIRRKIGGIEKVRNDLGLSARKMSQLLMVDPSAYSRWVKGGDEAVPPHIWRALSWYLALNERFPGLEPELWLRAGRQGLRDEGLRQEMERLRHEIQIHSFNPVDHLEPSGHVVRSHSQEAIPGFSPALAVKKSWNMTLIWTALGSSLATAGIILAVLSLLRKI